VKRIAIIVENGMVFHTYEDPGINPVVIDMDVLRLGATLDAPDFEFVEDLLPDELVEEIRQLRK
jgi:hypothetical protein